MRFPYREVPGEVPGEVEYEPHLVVRAIGPVGDRLFSGIIDTGSPYTLLPYRYLDEMKVQVLETRRLGVANRTGMTAHFGILDLELTSLDRLQSYRWPAWVGFCRRDGAIWGHLGFLDHFTASFDGEGKRVSLRPNRTMPDMGPTAER